MALASYATPTDLATYLDAADATANSTIWTTLLAAASRFIDEKCNRSFYVTATGTERWFSVPNDNQTSMVTFSDFYTLTQLRVLKTENGDITDATKYDVIAGDGITPPSNFYLLPNNPDFTGTASSPSSPRPYWGIRLANVPMANTAPPTIFTKGLRTVGITASWGWPAVPDLVKNLTLKLAARAWQSKSTGWTDYKGSPEIGMVSIARHFDSEDQYLLARSDLVANYYF